MCMIKKICKGTISKLNTIIIGTEITLGHEYRWHATTKQ